MDTFSPLPDTELLNPLFQDLEQKPLASLIDMLLVQHAHAVQAVQNASPAIELAVRACAAHLSKGGRLLYAGAGTSGRLGVMDGAELIPTFGWPTERVGFLMAGGMPALIEAQEGAEDDKEAALKDIDTIGLSPNDVLILLSASGNTPYVLALAHEAFVKGVLTIGVTNNEQSLLLSQSTHAIYLKTGSEALQGSTRLKAGTAQKIFLSTFSTALMAQLGYVYKGFMINLRTTNDKLRKRQRNIIMQLTGLPRESAENLLKESKGDLKVAVLMNKKGLSCDAAGVLLAQSGGDLHYALSLK